MVVMWASWARGKPKVCLLAASGYGFAAASAAVRGQELRRLALLGRLLRRVPEPDQLPLLPLLPEEAERKRQLGGAPHRHRDARIARECRVARVDARVAVAVHEVGRPRRSVR